MPVGKYLGFSIIAWGTVLACHAACKSFAGLVVVRTLLGLFESACQPAFVVLSAMWYRREEQASRVTYWYMMNGAQQIVGGLLAYCFSLITSGPLKSWQWLFLSYGIISVAFGVFVLWYMPDSPMRAKCYTEDDVGLHAKPALPFYLPFLLPPLLPSVFLFVSPTFGVLSSW